MLISLRFINFLYCVYLMDKVTRRIVYLCLGGSNRRMEKIT